MPSGRTHDRITLWSLPLVAGLTYGRTQSSNLTLLVAGGFLFGGLMFGPDLDIYSRQYQRWGWLRWIWLPYRKMMRHRSFWSHGPVVGTALRLLYLATWLSALSLVGVTIAAALGYAIPDWSTATHLAQQSVLQYSPEVMALCLGLELGALSHSCSDWLSSTYKSTHKRYKTQGWKGLFYSKPKKRQRKSAPRAKPQSRIMPTKPQPRN
ncbi:metal-binding protein [Trichocoleus sp. FACHB-262]|uniref:metal-binding protein n=1 Tax=Trichocoleus sp. FACHB-262 TaxID=2692869 RepID=UPI001689ED5B|nr:metal-binding protein [Trichocoleus sp. FACHB-262]MBD2124300.1 metal-binding protein [Trichocoleus sp. FACHB-262]